MQTDVLVDLTFDTFAENVEQLTIAGKDYPGLAFDETTGATLAPGGYWGDFDARVLCRASDLDGVALQGIRRATWRGSAHHVKEFSRTTIPGGVVFHLKCDPPPR